jgi:spore coat protein A
MLQTIVIRTILILALIQMSFLSPGAIVDVYVYNNEFSINLPGNPIVPATIVEGDTIRWVWVQGGHTTTAVIGSPEQWDMPINSSNTSYVRQFNSQGVFTYYCIPHGNDNGDGTASGMSSAITVLAAGNGACCLTSGNCIMTDQGNCLAQDGSFAGIGTLCDTTTCELELEIIAQMDNILYQDAAGAISNGMGQYLYVGNNASGIRRGLVKFVLDSVPQHAELVGGRVQLYCNSSAGSPFPVSVQKLLQDWGEGNSDANGNEGSGASAAPGDATWIHSYFDTINWVVVGGYFDTTITAVTEVDAANVLYSWDSPQLLNDVEYWLNNPDKNYGWIFKGDESTTGNSKRFSSAQNGDPTEDPRLVLEFVVPPTGACCLPDGLCQDLTNNQCLAAGGEYEGDGTFCANESCQIQLAPFLDSLPRPAVAIPESGISGGRAHYRFFMQEQFQQLHSELPPTRVWGYNGVYPGPTIEARRDSLVTVQWINDLREFESGLLRTKHALYVDTCLHGPNITGEVPVTVTHLHGGKVPQGSDGFPETTFPPGDSSGKYYYPNIQPAGILWYHDHALGITRLNVMMGLAGFYLLRDANEDTLGLPSGEFEIPLAIQDRSFNPDGSFQYPTQFEDHFFGDMILVNGKVWPYLNVKQGKYRFRLLNGSNSRSYTLSLSNSAPMTMIGVELGLRNSPISLDSLTLHPGERADVIVDFSSYAGGTEILLKNSAPAPFPGFPGVGVIPDVMKFIVQNEPGFSSAIPDSLAVVNVLDTADTVQERLFELLLATGPSCDGVPAHPAWTINGLLWDTITEFPVFGTSEIWTWHNQTGISHPMHMHLIAFQILDRQAIDEVSGLPVGPLLPPEPYEKGWKDTAHSPPGYRTRVITRFEGFSGKFSYHCHILEHEDHEMMRQFEVRPCILVTQTTDGGPGSLRYAIECAQSGDTILFSEELVGDTIVLLDSILLDKNLSLWNHHNGPITIDASGIIDPITILTNAEVELINLTLISGVGNSGRAITNYGFLLLNNIKIFDDILMLDSGIVLLNKNYLFAADTVGLFAFSSDSLASQLILRNDGGVIIVDSSAALYIDMNLENVNGSEIFVAGTGMMEVTGQFYNDLGSTITTGEQAVLVIKGIGTNTLFRSGDSSKYNNLLESNNDGVIRNWFIKNNVNRK